MDQFAIDACLASLQLKPHAVDSVIARLGGALHAINSLLSLSGSKSFTINSDLSLLVSGHHAVDSLICPTPGFAIFGPGTASWTCPPGVHTVNAYLWGEGREGDAYQSTWAGSAGGGGGYAQGVNRAVHPGGIYPVVVHAADVGGLQTFLMDGGPIQTSGGGPGTVAGGGNGGTGLFGDVNYVGGKGGDAGDPIHTLWGAGGGSGAGPLGNGNNGQDATLTAEGQGGAAISGMGEGGQGGHPNGTSFGLPGHWPGGGGGGQAKPTVFVPQTKASGGDGLLIVTWDAAVFFIDAVLSMIANNGHAVDSFLAARVILTHAINSLLAQMRTVTYSIDSLLSQKVSSTHGLTSLLGSKQSIANALTSLLAKKVSATHGLTSLLGKKLSATHGLTSLLASKKTATHTIDSDLWKNYLYDLFVDANGTLLSAHTPNLGPGWTMFVFLALGATSDVSIQSNQATDTNSTVGSFIGGYMNAGATDATNTITFIPSNVTSPHAAVCGLLARLQDASNFWYLQANTSTIGGSNKLQIYSYITGVLTSRASVTMPTLVAGTTYTLSLQCAGNVITGTLSGPGITTTSVTFTSSSLNLQTRWGIVLYRDQVTPSDSCPIATFRVYP